MWCDGLSGEERLHEHRHPPMPLLPPGALEGGVLPREAAVGRAAGGFEGGILPVDVVEEVRFDVLAPCGPDTAKAQNHEHDPTGRLGSTATQHYDVDRL